MTKIRDFYFFHPTFWPVSRHIGYFFALLILMVFLVRALICSVSEMIQDWQRPEEKISFDSQVYQRLSEAMQLKRISQNWPLLQKNFECKSISELSSATQVCLKIELTFVEKTNPVVLQRDMTGERITSLEKSCMRCHAGQKNQLVRWKIAGKKDLSSLNLTSQLGLFFLLIVGVLIGFQGYYVGSRLWKRLNQKEAPVFIFVSLRYKGNWDTPLGEFLHQNFFSIASKLKILLAMPPFDAIKVEKHHHFIHIVIAKNGIGDLLKSLAALNLRSQVNVSESSLSIIALQFNHRLTHVRSYLPARLAALLQSKLKNNVVIMDADLADEQVLKISPSNWKSAEYKSANQRLRLKWLKVEDFLQT